MSPLRSFAVLVILLLCVGAASYVRAEGCGTITGPKDIYQPNSPIVTVPIQNCANPFVTTQTEFVGELSVGGQIIHPGALVVVPETGERSYGYTAASSEYGSIQLDLYRHQDSNFNHVPFGVPERTEAQYRSIAEAYFGTGVAYETYLEAFLTNDYERFEDDEEANARYHDFLEHLDTLPDLDPVPLLPGTYTLVVTEAEVYSTEKPPSILDWFIATAYAQGLPNRVTSITFTLTAEELPTGASSVLFLPGIQASRLYKDGLFGTEDQLWEPNANNDIEQLVMNERGQSVHEIYTKEVIDEILFPRVGANIYKGFLSQLEQYKEDKKIVDWHEYAYDWRFNVEDVVVSGTRYENEVRGLRDIVEDLAKSSYTGKVTIVAHSNGGLLAKALVSDLEVFNEADRIDQIIFIGTPHLGTPKAIATILHGFDQQKLGGLVIDDVTARKVIKNMPGTYSLLPSKEYLRRAGDPLVWFGEGPLVSLLSNAYGQSIDTFAEYQDFLKGSENRAVDEDDVSGPSVVNSILFDRTISQHEEKWDHWQPPPGVKLHSIIGVGLKSVASLAYREVTERTECSFTLGGQIICNAPEVFLRPYVTFTQYGDETVVSLSAEAVEGEKYYFNLDSYNRSLLNPLLSYDHADFTEIDDVQELLGGILLATSTNPEFFTEVPPTFTTEYEVLSIDSPVRILKQDAKGRRAGVVIEAGQVKVLEEIPGSQYFEIAGAKYLISPKTPNATVRLYGEAPGSYSLTVATLKSNDIQVIESELVNATTTSQMQASFSYNDGAYSTLLTDYNGDGKVDAQTTLAGEPVSVVTFDTLRNQIKALGLSSARAKTLLLLVDMAERASKIPNNHRLRILGVQNSLKALAQVLNAYTKNKYLSSSENATIQITINSLKESLK